MNLKNGSPTIIALGGQTIGQRNRVSAGDIAAVNTIYPAEPTQPQIPGIQFRGTLEAGETRTWITDNWPQEWHVAWLIVPIEPNQIRAPQIKWEVMVERQQKAFLSYYICVRNLTSIRVSIEARYMILNEDKLGN